MKEIWQWAIWGKSQITKWCKEQFIWWTKQTLLIQGFAFVASILVCAFVVAVIGFGGYGLFYQDPSIARNLILLTAGIIGWYFLARRTKAAELNVETAEQGLTVERLTRAIEQLASENPSIRLGGILGLEQIADTHGEERKKIARILISFIHTRATKDSEEVKKNITASRVSKLETEEEFSAYRVQRLDIEAAVNALSRIASELERQKQFREQYNEKKQHLCDLQNIDLRGLRFVEADLSNFEFAGADMSGAWLAHANFAKANFCKHDHDGREFTTKFIGAFLDDTDFSDAWLVNVDFSSANLARANFGEAYLYGTIFNEANIDDTNFENSEGLTQKQVSEADYFFGNPPHLPDGLKATSRIKKLVKKDSDEN
ncbi:MAG: pentapeptide repeat-containing protein [Hyphomicrobiales bacterium]|nr:pentapeptide repeat-containing protein [Hyphomicrobiales bacterium]